MKQTLVIVRGAPASGKTTLCSQLRDTENKIAWLSVDGIKPIFSNFDDRDIDISYQTALEVLKFLLEHGYSVVFDGIFVRPEHQEYLQQALQIAEEKGVQVKIYQLTVSLETALKRHSKREWAREGEKEAALETVKRLHEKVKNAPIEGAIELNTEESSLEECVNVIRKELV
jgi:predicted kinase